MPDALKSLFKRIQDGMEGVADAVLGERAERLLDSEIRTVDDGLHAARGDHAAAKARRRLPAARMRTVFSLLVKASPC